MGLGSKRNLMIQALSNWWTALTAWNGWGWPGWVAIGSIGAAGALLFLAYQTWRLWRDRTTEANQRREDDQRRREDFQFRHTPLLSATGASPVDLHGQNSVTVRAELHADGDGVAYNVIINLFGLLDGNRHGGLGNPVVVAQVRPPANQPVTFTYELDDLPHKPQHHQALPHQVQLEVGFFNMFGQRVVFSHTARVEGDGLTITDPPSFTWPWKFAERSE